jgi:hypothetical protein
LIVVAHVTTTIGRRSATPGGSLRVLDAEETHIEELLLLAHLSDSGRNCCDLIG